jgi:hypothetical protein
LPAALEPGRPEPLLVLTCASAACPWVRFWWVSSPYQPRRTTRYQGQTSGAQTRYLASRLQRCVGSPPQFYLPTQLAISRFGDTATRLSVRSTHETQHLALFLPGPCPASAAAAASCLYGQLSRPMTTMTARRRRPVVLSKVGFLNFIYYGSILCLGSLALNDVHCHGFAIRGSSFCWVAKFNMHSRCGMGRIRRQTCDTYNPVRLTIRAAHLQR